MTDFVRTAEENFVDLPDFPYAPNYHQWQDLRMHYVDEGPRDGPVMLLLHGMPTWAFLYRDMIPGLTAAGYRCIAPDHIGFGRSDKPTDIHWYTIARHTEILTSLIVELDLTNITLVCQDWGGPTGLAQAAMMPERFDHLSLPSPFPREHRRLVIDDAVATTYRERDAYYQPIAQRLAEFAEKVPGNSMALFPSYKFLDEVGRRIVVKNRRVLIQSRSNSEQEREAILESLRASLAGDALLLAVAGGVFAEGVDYPGDMLRAVAVVGPCLPAVSLERQLLRDYYQQHFERGFEYAFVVPGMTRVVQAVGRLIRSAEDTGVIALMDRRFLAQPYRHFLPSDWSEDQPVEALVAEPASAASAFFGALESDAP